MLEEAKFRKTGSGKLVAGGVVFFLLTAGIFWQQFHQLQAEGAGPTWDRLQWRYFLLILLCLPIETIASGLRMWVVCRILQPGVRLWTCVKAEWANVAISLLTPSQSGGGPGQIYILKRDGASVGTALTISLLSFVGTMVGLLCMGLYTLLLSRVEEAGPLFVAAVWTLIAISAAMILAAISPRLLRIGLGAISRAFWGIRGKPGTLHDWWPPGQIRTSPPADRLDRLTGKLADIIYTYRNDVTRFVRVGAGSFAWVCLLSFIFLLARCLLAYLCVRFLGIQTSSLRHIMEAQTALIFLIFFAPTPGGAGVAESASFSIMADIVPAAFVPYYNLLWRFSTAYLAAVAGLFCLLHAFVQDAPKALRSTWRLSSLTAAHEGREFP